MQNDITINEEQRLYVIGFEGGYSCLGFDVCSNRTKRIADWYGVTRLQPTEAARGSMAGYEQYQLAIAYARTEHERTGIKCGADLSPQLKGLEGKKVEVVDVRGMTRRFTVGKSTGFIPCHLEIIGRDRSGGGAAEREYKSVRVIG